MTTTDEVLQQSERTTRNSVSIRLVGGPTAVIEIGGLRLLTDPTFDQPGDHPVGQRILVKTTGPAVQPADLGRIDAVLLSHDQHPDNLDASGREFLQTVPRAFTTAEGARRLGGVAEELPWWKHATLPLPAGGELRIVGVPAFHGPVGSESITGPVTGFVLSGPGLATVYVSGDNASLDAVQTVADNVGPIDVALLFAGAARTPVMDAYLTLTSAQAARAAAILQPATIVAVHAEGWGHFTEGQTALRDAFARHGVEDQLALLAPGEQRDV